MNVTHEAVNGNDAARRTVGQVCGAAKGSAVPFLRRSYGRGRSAVLECRMGQGTEDDVIERKGSGPTARVVIGGLLALTAPLACSEDAPLDQVAAPIAALTATPSQGVAPLQIEFDAGQSHDPTSPGATLTAQFDFEGDGVVDVQGGELKVRHTFTTAGTFLAKLKIVAGDGRSAEATTELRIQANTPPTAALRFTPGSGAAPLVVELDASASSDPDQDTASLEVRFDFEGDGTFDTEFSTTKTAAHTYAQAGEQFPTVEVRDRAGATATFRASPALVVNFGADLAVDTNRDGIIDSNDELGEDDWSESHGALFLANLDDDDQNGRQDGKDTAVNGAEDFADMATILIRRHGDAMAGRDQATLSLEPASAKANVRVYVLNGSRPIGLLTPEGEASAAVDVAALAAGDTTLYLEGVNTRTPTWDGRVTLRLSLTIDGAVQEDAVTLRVAPVIFTDNLQAARALYVMRISDRRLGENLPFSDALRDGIPSGVELVEADQYEYGGDRWLQDNMQAGYQTVAGPGGAVVEMPTFLQTQRPTGQGGLELYLPNDFLAAGHGYVYPGRSRDTSLNYGGNLEVMPPYETDTVSYPFGRLILGGGALGTLGGVAYEDHMGELQHSWLDAQGVQGPAVEISSEWLAVGHIDETFQIIPNPAAAPGAKPYKVVYASPSLARQLLTDVQAAGGGARQVFAGRQTQTTVDAILRDPALAAVNDAAQARLDSNKDIMKRELGLTDEDFVDVPVMYEIYEFDGLDLAAALNPGIQNLVTTNTTLFIPDPEGPAGDDGVDVWKRSTEEALRPLGVEVHFVDVFDSYHLNLGEAHCGTNVLAVPYATPWWTKAVGPRNR